MPPEKSTHPSIECAKNGPYRVRNVETFTSSTGPALIGVVSDPDLI